MRKILVIGLLIASACTFRSWVPVTVEVTHEDGTTESIEFNQSGKLSIHKRNLVMSWHCGGDSVISREVSSFTIDTTFTKSND